MTPPPEWSELGPRPSVSMSARTQLTSHSPLLGAPVPAAGRPIDVGVRFEPTGEGF